MTLRDTLEKQGNWLFRWRSYLPLLFLPLLLVALKNFEFIEQKFGDDIGDLWESIAIAVSFLGFAIRCFTVGFVPRRTSGRNTKSQVAEVLNTTGMYSVTRNPLYLGNFLIVLGVALFIQVWWLVLAVWAGFWFYHERIIFSEEEFLRRKFGEDFTSWARKTPMIIPDFKQWQKPDLSFSFKTVLRREFSTYFAIASVYFLLEIIGDFCFEKHYSIRASWLIFFCSSLILYLTLVVLKKKTHVLDVPGR